MRCRTRFSAIRLFLNLFWLSSYDKTATIQKEFKAGTFVGGLFIWPLLFWCYGPAPIQNYKLEKQ